MSATGFLISIEGIDGSGKTTLAKGLVSALQQEGQSVMLTRQPGATQLGQQIRTLVQSHKSIICDRAEYLLFAADRAQHMEQVVLPALAQGVVVVSDRMTDSSLAYQGFGRGIDLEVIQSVNKWAMSGRMPDLVLYVRIDVETALSRVMQRGAQLTSFEQEKMAFWRRVAQGYEHIFANRADVVVLDGILEEQALCQQALAAMKRIRSQSC